MTMEGRIASDPQFVKRKLIGELGNLFEVLLRGAESGARPRELEIETWKVLFAIGRLVLATLLGVFLIPFLYFVVKTFSDKIGGKAKAGDVPTSLPEPSA